MNTENMEEFEAKPEAIMHVVWQFRLGKADSLLMLKALGGRLTDAEIKPAKALGDRLTVLRNEAGGTYLHALERAANGAQGK